MSTAQRFDGLIAGCMAAECGMEVTPTAVGIRRARILAGIRADPDILVAFARAGLVMPASDEELLSLIVRWFDELEERNFA